MTTLTDTDIRVYIGTESKTRVASRVLAHSIKVRTKAQVQIHYLEEHPHWEFDFDLSHGTRFSLRRWLIPEFCQWQGRAIYLDADQLVVGDIEELWYQPLVYSGAPGTSVWCTYQPDEFQKAPWPQSSVMVIDCEAAKTGGFGWQRADMLEWLRAHRSRQEYASFMHGTWLKPQPQAIGNEWNCLNRLKPGDRLLHFTGEPTQPWYDPKHKHAELWRQELQAAIQAGEIQRLDYEVALRRWGHRPDGRPNGLNPLYRKYLPLFPS